MLRFCSIFLISILIVFKNSWSAGPSTSREKLELYGYHDRSHSKKEIAIHLTSIYALSWAFYPLTQPKTFKNKGSTQNYKDNFGKVVFDQDGPFWNWMVHPLSGSQLFLFYRANGYSKIDSLGMSFISSALFEFTAEIYTEPASFQDLYQTPILGSLLGAGIETFSLYLLNTGNFFAKVIGHTINPATLMWFYEGPIKLTPYISPLPENPSAGLFLKGEF